jgi:hypothetical protein
VSDGLIPVVTCPDCGATIIRDGLVRLDPVATTDPRARWTVSMIYGRPHAEAAADQSDSPLFPQLRFRLHGIQACAEERRKKGTP